MENNQIVKSALNQCNSIENENIDLTSQVCVRTQIGFVSCNNIDCYQRIIFIMRLANMKQQDIQRVTGMCKNKILIKYNSSYFTAYKSINVIVIPSFLTNQWESNMTDPLMRIVKGVNDFSKISDIDFHTLVIPANMIEKLVIWLNISEIYAVNKIILDSCDDINLPSYLNINYNFLWIIGHGFIDEYINEECSLRTKGFLKRILEELFSSFALDISKHFMIELNGTKTMSTMKYIVSSKKTIVNNINEALDNGDVYNAVSYTHLTLPTKRIV